MRVVIDAGRHTRVMAPVTVPHRIDGPVCVRLDDGTVLPGQAVPDGTMVIVPHMARGSVLTGTIGPGTIGSNNVGFVRRDDESAIDVTVNGEFLTAYVYSADYAKPYLGPIVGPNGKPITRLDPDTKEHPHHRSVWFSHGDVNGVDTWNEPKDKGYERQTSLTVLGAGPVFGSIKAECTWTDGDGKPLLDDARTYTFHNTPRNHTVIDLTLTLRATHGRVVLGATKEAGPLGVRVAESMRGDAGGTLTNAYGAVGESECWGRRAPWCDYYGDVDGSTVGIAVFDHPSNPGYPSYWHIRDYGLMAINNFYWAGPVVMEPGEVLDHRFRLVFHSGTTAEADIGEHYHAYINPPKVSVTAG